MGEDSEKDFRIVQKSFDFLDGSMVYYKGYEKMRGDGFKKAISNAIKEGRLILAIVNFVRYDLFIPYCKYYLIKLNYLTRNQYFIVAGKKYKYHLKKMQSVDNEQAIEVPYSLAFVLNNKTHNFLEVGNVLSNYFDMQHDVVDKYETADGIINKDICSYDTEKRYDLIVSISTVEHIGYDELNKVKGKALRSIRSMMKLLKKNGKLLISVPLNYNLEIDNIIVNKKIQFSEKHFMKRVSWFNIWKETNQADALKYKYNRKYRNSAANAVSFLIYKK